MATHFRKNVFQKENQDHDAAFESQRKKAEYQRVLLQQIQDKQAEKEQRLRLEKEQEVKNRKELESMNSQMQGRMQQKVNKNKQSPVQADKDIPATPSPPSFTNQTNISNKLGSQKGAKSSSDAPKEQRLATLTPNEDSFVSPLIKLQTIQPKNPASSNSNLFNYQPRVPSPERRPSPPQKLLQRSRSLTSSKFEGSKDADALQAQIEDYINRQMDSLNSMVHSTQQCINTSLSKKYVLQHEKVNDYSTIAHDGARSPGHFHYRDYSKHYTSEPQPDLKAVERSLALEKELRQLSEQALRAANERDNRRLELERLRNDFQRMKQLERERQERFRVALERMNGCDDQEQLVRSFLGESVSVQLPCETDFIYVG